MMEIITEVNRLGDIPYMFYYTKAEGTTKRPLVIYSHGFNCNQYSGASLALQLAQKGVSVVTYDLSEHGARYNGFMERIESDTDIGNSIFRILESSYSDLETLIEHFSEDPRIDASRIGITGGSLGAKICYYALTRNRSVKVAVPIIGSPNFVEQIIYSMEKENEQQFETPAELALLETAKRLDPLESLVATENRPLLMINASKDDDVPYRYAEGLYERLKERYEQSRTPLEFYVAEEFHFFSDEMIERAIGWFEKYL
jgi:uncharacterized protein